MAACTGAQRPMGLFGPTTRAVIPSLGTPGSGDPVASIKPAGAHLSSGRPKEVIAWRMMSKAEDMVW